MMSTEPKRRIEADEFVLRDAHGAVRAALTMTTDGAGLFLYDENRIVRTRFLIEKDEPGLVFFDSLGRPRMSLGVADDEVWVMLRDAKGTSRVSMIVEETGTRLTLSDAKPGARVGISTQSGEANLVFVDPIGKPRIVLGMPGGVPGLTLLDAGGRRRARMEVTEDTSTFELYDPDGNISSRSTLAGVEPLLHDADTKAKLSIKVLTRQQLEETLRAREKRYNALTAATAQLVWTTNAAGEIIEDTPSWRSFTGQTEEEIKESGWMQALHPEDRERLEGGLETSSGNAQPLRDGVPGAREGWGIS